jgi:hypothetical protein
MSPPLLEHEPQAAHLDTRLPTIPVCFETLHAELHWPFNVLAPTPHARQRIALHYALQRSVRHLRVYFKLTLRLFWHEAPMLTSQRDVAGDSKSGRTLSRF